MNFIHLILHRIKEFFGDIGAYLRFGLKNQIKGFFAWIGDRVFMMNLWRESLPAARKTHQKEAMDSLRNIGNRVLQIPQVILSVLWNLVRSPSQGWEQVKNGVNRLRSLSLKEILQALWQTYVSLITATIFYIEDLITRWSSTRLIFRIFSSVAIVCLIFVAIFARTIIDEAKQFRAQQLLQEANILEEQKYDIKAYEKLRSAALLNHKNTEVLERTMEAAKTLRTPEAVWWSEQMSREKSFDAESLAKVIDYAVDFHRVPTGAKYLARLQAQHPDSPETIDTELKLLLSQGHRNRALNRVREMLEAGQETPLVHDIYIGLTNKSDPEQAEMVTKHHQENLFRKDEIGIHLCELALVPSLPSRTEDIKFDYLEILNHLRTFEEPESEMIILAIGRSYEAGQLQREEAIDQILAEYDLKDSDERTQAYRTLNFFHLGGVEDRLILSNDLKRDRDLAQQLLYSLLMSDRPDLERAESMLSFNKKDNALSESDKHFWLSLIKLRNGDVDNYTLELLQALDKANVLDWPDMEKIIKAYAAPPQQLVLYRELFGLTDNNPYTAEKYIELLYDMGALDELTTVLKQIRLEQFAGDPGALSLMIYLKSAYALDLERCRYLGETLIEEFPEIYFGYISLSFAYYQSGHPQMARALLESVPMSYKPEELPSYLRFSYATVMDDRGYLPNPGTARLQSERAFFLVSPEAKDISLLEDNPLKHESL